MANEKINLYVLTGFLGSGKTTVLLNILDALKEERVGVIQNEFGKLGIDGDIIRKDNIEMVEINKGSIFCSCLKLSFVQALAEMSKQNLKYLFVESSGLADPSNIEEILKGVEALSGGAYEFKGAICLIDAVNFEEQLNDIETVNRQLKHCNMAIINKIDLVDDNKIEDLIKSVRVVNPVCEIEKTSFGKLNYDFLTKDLLLYKWAECEETTNSVQNKPKTLILNYYKSIEKEKLNSFLNIIKKHCYRLKGFFDIDGEWNQVDVVGDQIDYKPCEQKQHSEMVVISKVGPAIIKTLFTTWEETVGDKVEIKN
ncbi:GTP-binding protein [Sedimentibacter sp. zth1]|uniref:CobW family GTP-binding protein n=1 Tax=Sedimentibacter sp. zth1 TaxID=2816908 RepID=UPI001A923344|nr:GTP-binding protein [Sedimentibacter sp. zth1]QSX05765.1 GTP-binding protein [Sedimentibacter sp. zth1]